MLTGKIWGSTELLWNSGAEVHRLDVIPEHHCSWHTHAHKANAFFVFAGKLIIERRKSYGLVDRTVLKTGDFTVVPAGEPHRFVTEEEPARAIEVYWPMPLADDILREDNGGPNEPQDMPARLARDAAAVTDGRSRAKRPFPRR